MLRTDAYRPRAAAALALLALSTIAAACTEANAPEPPFGPGTYELVSANGQGLPYTIPNSDGKAHRTITGATIIVWAPDSLRSGTAQLVIVPPETGPAAGAARPAVVYEVRGGDSVFVVGPDPGPTGPGTEDEYFLARGTGRELRGEFSWRLSALSDSLIFLGDYARVQMVFRRR